MATIQQYAAHFRWRPAVAGDRRRIAAVVIVLCAGLCVVSAVLSLSLGPVPIDVLGAALAVLGGEEKAAAELRDSLILFEIRLPRTALALLVGGALASAGAMLQGLFRNPLADPGLVGVSAGAALAAVTVIVLGERYLSWLLSALSIFALPAAAIAGGLATTLLLYAISTRQGRTSIATMLLAGIAIGALAAAATGVLVFISTDQQLRDLTFWTLGSFSGATWLKLAAALPFIVPIFVVAPFVGHGLNGLLLGEAEARHIGIDTERVKRAAVACIALSVGASVAAAGVIGFVGIIVPHVLRLVIGPDHRYLLSASVLLGGALLVAADSVARIVVAPAELPTGIMTALIGAPFFLWLLLRQKGFVDV